jgi:hypothetical protein
MLTAIAALICIILGFVSAFASKQVLMPPLDWFVVAIAFNTFDLPSFSFTRKVNS